LKWTMALRRSLLSSRLSPPYPTLMTMPPEMILPLLSRQPHLLRPFELRPPPSNHRFAASHHTFVQQTTAERLNKHGIPAHFNVNDRVKIYMPPTHAQIQRTGQRSQHIVTWRGPWIITEVLSDSTYRVQEDCSKRFFERSIMNMRPFRASSAPTPPPHHDLLSTLALTPGTLVAVRDTPTSAFHIARLTALTESNASLHYLGTTNPNFDRAVFKLLWLFPDNKTVLKDTRPARNHAPITGDISTEDLPDLLVATHLALTAAG
jgi:hypothetical protein